MGSSWGWDRGQGWGAALCDVGVVTCLAAQFSSISPTAPLAAALEHAGAAIVVDDGIGVVAAFRRVTDAVRAAIVMRDAVPADTRIALSAGETRGGEFGAVAEKASRLAAQADPGSTILTKLAATLAIDHLPRHQQLRERRLGESRVELSYELHAAIAQPA